MKSKSVPRPTNNMPMNPLRKTRSVRTGCLIRNARAEAEKNRRKRYAVRDDAAEAVGCIIASQVCRPRGAAASDFGAENSPPDCFSAAGSMISFRKMIPRKEEMKAQHITFNAPHPLRVRIPDLKKDSRHRKGTCCCFGGSGGILSRTVALSLVLASFVPFSPRR